MIRQTSSTCTLGTTPLLHLLAFLADQRVSGSITLLTPDSMHGIIVFERGAPKKVSVAAPRCKLGELLIEFGWLDAAAAKQTYEEASERQEPHGQVLIEHQLVNEGGLLHVLLYQFIRKLDWIATRPAETVLELHPDCDLLETMSSLPELSPLTVLWGVAKNHVDENHKRALLEQFEDAPLKLHERSAPELFGFSDAEMVLVERLRQSSSTLSDLLYQIDLPRAKAEALVYTLLLTRHMDLGDGQLPIGLSFPSYSRVTSEPPQRRSRRASSSGERVSAGCSLTPGPSRRINHSLARHTRRRAEQLLKQDRLLRAEAEAQRAQELDPDHPENTALCLWIQSLLSTDPDELDRLLVGMDATLERFPSNAQLRFYRAGVLKRLGRFEQAAEEWHRVVELDPNHLEALRELRLWEMRRVSGGPPRKLRSGVRPLVNFQEQTTGLFGRLLKVPR